MQFFAINSGKSGKRELAISLVMLWAFITVRHFMWIASDDAVKMEESWSTLTWATLGFAAAAYGIDFVMKNLPSTSASSNRRPKRELRKSDTEIPTGAI